MPLFTQEELDCVLYGYMMDSTNNGAGLSMSGLRVETVEDSSFYGENSSIRITYGLSPNSRSVFLQTILLQDIPEGLIILKRKLGRVAHCGVFCQKNIICKGTRYGPFIGRIVNTTEIKIQDDNTYMWEIFHEGKLSHFIDGRNSSPCWMSFVNCARYAQEQNLIAVQNENEIYYEACKDIPQGMELLVWYGDGYLQFMGIPVSLKDMPDKSIMEDHENSKGYHCEQCGKVFAYRYYRDKHLKYTSCVDKGDRKFPCHLCKRSFEKRDRLRIHILHVHEKHRPHKCSVCGKSFSQSSSLNKHMRVHSGERPYKCVYCSKAFTASSILRTHIRQHSGEKPFKCKHCGKAFASHAAHDSHVRRTHIKDKSCNCSVCGKAFEQVFELKLHVETHTENLPFVGEGQYACDKLEQNFTSLISRDIYHRLHMECSQHQNDYIKEGFVPFVSPSSGMVSDKEDLNVNIVNLASDFPVNLATSGILHS